MGVQQSFQHWQHQLSGKSILPLLINMDNAKDRLERTQKLFAAHGLAINRVQAVVGRELSFPIPEFSALSYRLLHGRRTTPAEVGCFLSHVKCAKLLLESDHDFALICEDDLYFEGNFANLLELAAANSNDWDILRLTTVNNHTMLPFKALDETYSLAIALTRKKGAGAYVINRRAAGWITQKLIPMRLAYDIAFDLEHLAGLKAAFIYPLPAHQNRESDSQIQNNIKQYKLPRWRYFTVLPYRAWLETSRFICRSTQLGINWLRYGWRRQMN